jgi:hypothetical protein
MKGLDLILLFSMPKHHLSLLNKNDVPVKFILHGTDEISLHRIQGFKQCLVVLKVSRRLRRQSILDPAPCTRPWMTMPCTKRFLDQFPLYWRIPLQTFKLITKETEELERQQSKNARDGLEYGGLTECFLVLQRVQPGLVNEHVMFHYHL